MVNPFRLLAPAPRRIQRDSFELRLPDGSATTVLRVRDPRARRLKLIVDERGVRLTLPPRASLVSGERFATEHGDWLQQQLASSRALATMPFERGITSRLPLRGAELPLRWQAGRYTGLQFDGDGALVFSLPPQAGEPALRRCLRDFYLAQARADAGRWLPRYLPGLPRAPRQLRIKPMSSQWGSLAPDGTLALDLALVLARPSAFEYVLVHELCHLIHANHSRAFWREVETRCPHWRGERDYFREHGRALKAQLRTMLNG